MPELLKIETKGIPELLKELAAKSKALQATFGLMVKKGAENTKEEIQNKLYEFGGVDTETLLQAIDTRKLGPYEWQVGDFNYPAGVIPYGIFVEMGFGRHFISRRTFMQRPIPSRRLAWFYDIPPNHPLGRGIWVGPRAGRPFFLMGTLSADVKNIEFYKKKINEALKVK